MTNEKLYNAILSARLISHGDDFFIQKLMYKNGWSQAKAAGLYAEYKRFLYISTLTSVIPPVLIDTVWHEHILFTKEYDDLTIVLGKKLHHYPDIPGAYVTDQTNWKKTLDMYVQEFGESKGFQKYWLGLNAWQRFWRNKRLESIKKRNTNSGSSGSSNSSTSSCSACSSGLSWIPFIGCSSGTSSESSSPSGCSSSSCSSCSSGCGGGCGGS